MSQTRLDFGIDIGLNLGPFFRVRWWMFWDLGAEISRLDGWDNTLRWQAIEVVNDYRNDWLTANKATTFQLTDHI